MISLKVSHRVYEKLFSSYSVSTSTSGSSYRNVKNMNITTRTKPPIAKKKAGPLKSVITTAATGFPINCDEIVTNHTKAKMVPCVAGVEH